MQWNTGVMSWKVWGSSFYAAVPKLISIGVHTQCVKEDKMLKELSNRNSHYCTNIALKCVMWCHSPFLSRLNYNLQSQCSPWGHQFLYRVRNNEKVWRRVQHDYGYWFEIFFPSPIHLSVRHQQVRTLGTLGLECRSHLSSVWSSLMTGLPHSMLPWPVFNDHALKQLKACVTMSLLRLMRSGARTTSLPGGSYSIEMDCRKVNFEQRLK